METLSEESKIYAFEQKVYKPSRKQGCYRYLVKPGQAKFISGRDPDGKVFSFTCENVSAGHYKKYVIDGGFDPARSEIEDFTVQIGDVLFNDMHIEHRPADGSKVTGSPAGIISYLADLNDEYTEGYVHGLVLAGKINSYSNIEWSYSQYTQEVSDYPDLVNCQLAGQAIKDKSGLSNSLAVRSTRGIGSFLGTHTTTSPIYEQASSWFIPSAGQWVKIFCAWGGKITSPMNRSGHIDFEYESKIQPGGTSMIDDIKYLWTPFFKITYAISDSPAVNKSAAFSSTEYSGSAIWFFAAPLSGAAPSAEIYDKTSQKGKVWKAFAF